MSIDLHKYTHFVSKITSDTSNDVESLVDRLLELKEVPNLNIALADTSAKGMCGEAGEFSEIFKKVIYHGKPFNDELRQHCKKELGDVIWYWTNACRALGFDPNEVIAENVNKLEARYPGGKFSVQASEVRAVGDI